MDATVRVSEIYRLDSEDLVPPLEEWEVEVLERGLSVNLGDTGGREAYIANARVLITEPDGSTWEGLTRLESA